MLWIGAAALLLALTLGWWVVTAAPEPPEARARDILLETLHDRRRAVYDNLKDLHFEKLAGKLSDDDFQRMRRMLEAEAADVVRALEST